MQSAIFDPLIAAQLAKALQSMSTPLPGGVPGVVGGTSPPMVSGGLSPSTDNSQGLFTPLPSMAPLVSAPSAQPNTSLNPFGAADPPSGSPMPMPTASMPAQVTPQPANPQVQHTGLDPQILNLLMSGTPNANPDQLMGQAQAAQGEAQNSRLAAANLAMPTRVAPGPTLMQALPALLLAALAGPQGVNVLAGAVQGFQGQRDQNQQWADKQAQNNSQVAATSAQNSEEQAQNLLGERSQILQANQVKAKILADLQKDQADRESRESIAKWADDNKVSLATMKGKLSAVTPLLKQAFDWRNGGANRVNAMHALNAMAADSGNGPMFSDTDIASASQKTTHELAETALETKRLTDAANTVALQPGQIKAQQAALDYKNAQTQGEKARADFTQTQNEWYPKNMQSQINKRLDDAKNSAINAQANLDRANKEASGDGITPSTRFRVLNQLTTSNGKADAAIQSLTTERGLLQDRLSKAKNGQLFMSPVDIQKTNVLLDSNAKQYAYWDQVKKNLQTQIKNVSSMKPAPTSGSNGGDIPPPDPTYKGSGLTITADGVKGTPPIRTGKTSSGIKWKVVG